MLILTAICGWSDPAAIYAAGDPHEHPEAATRDGSPGREKLRRALTLADYNTRNAMIGTVLLGAAAGMVGSFMLLRKQSLVGDVVSHAALPGIALAFITMELFSPGSGRSLAGLIIGAFLAGLLSIGCMAAIRKFTRIHSDPAMAIVLGIFFGTGIALMTLVVKVPSANPAGLSNLLMGAAAKMRAADVRLIAIIAAVTLVLCTLLFKELKLLCFDDGFAATQGWPVGLLDAVIMVLVVGVTVIGIQTVGLLIVGLMVIPPSAARFWTERLTVMVALAALMGAVSAWVGVILSSLAPKLATGPTIVLAGSFLFGLSLLLGARRGVILRSLRQWDVRRRIGRQDLLRAFLQFGQSRPTEAPNDRHSLTSQRPVEFDDLLASRSWRPMRLKRLLNAAQRDGLVRQEGDQYVLTEEGAIQARRVARNHRLWELYLIRYADIAPSHVDRDADEIEHVLEPDVVAELESLVAEGRT